VAIGRENLNNCVRGTGCLFNENPALDPGPPLDPPVVGDDFVIFGYSQSAVVASEVKQDLIDNPVDGGGNYSFLLLANPKRPNGGFLSRGPQGLTIPFLGVTFSEGTPTNSCDVGPCMETADLAAQYDGLGGDAAVGLTNVPAVLNAALGYYYLHGDLQNANFDDALYQGSHGDTDYYLFPTPVLPLLMPFEPVVPAPIIKTLDTWIRPVVEGGYRRDINPGIGTGVGLLPFNDPIQTLLNVITAIPTGIDDGVAAAANNPAFRPLGTAPVTSPFGVGGPQLPDPPSDMNLSALASSARAGDNNPADNDDTDAQSPGADEPDTGHQGAGADHDNTIADGREEETADDDAAAQTDDTTPATNAPGPTAQPTTSPTAVPSDAGTTDGQPDSGQDGADGAAGEAAA
jgi:hypothetical protein